MNDSRLTSRARRALALCAAVAAGTAALGVGAPAFGQAAPTGRIGINFVGGGGPDGDGNSITAPAGVVPQDNWNNLTDADGTFTNLINQDGGASPADITWDGDGTWSAFAENDTSGNHQLFGGYVDDFESTGGGGTNVGRYTISQVPYAVYDVYIYADSDATNGRRASYTIGATTFNLEDRKNFAADPTFDPVTSTTAGIFGTGNYMRFTNLIGADFELVTTAQTFRSFVSGIQIVEVPEPAGLAVLCIVAAPLLGRRRRRA